jgi:hypothetical protein
MSYMLDALAWLGTSLSRHIALNSGLSRQSSSTRGCTSALAPARAASTRNEPTTKRATLSQSYWAARICGSRKMKRRMLRCSGGSDP